MLIRILLADNQPLTASALVQLINDTEGIELAALVKDRNELRPLLVEHKPDILILDHNMDSYVSREDLRDVIKISPGTSVLVISSDNDKQSILDVVRTGIMGFLTKDCSHEEILAAIRFIVKGEKFFCQKILNIILEVSLAKEPVQVRKSDLLTNRELELLKLIAKGYSNQKAAQEMNLSPHTIHSHRKKITKKLGIKSPTQYVLFAIEFGLIE